MATKAKTPLPLANNDGLAMLECHSHRQSNLKSTV